MLLGRGRVLLGVDGVILVDGGRVLLWLVLRSGLVLWGGLILRGGLVLLGLVGLWNLVDGYSWVGAVGIVGAGFGVDTGGEEGGGLAAGEGAVIGGRGKSQGASDYCLKDRIRISKVS